MPALLNPDIRLHSLQLHHLIDYARRNYNAICFDLSGNLEKYCARADARVAAHLPGMLRPSPARCIWLVRRCSISTAWILATRVTILLNRYQKRFRLNDDEVESLVGAPVLMSFPNDYARLSTSHHTRQRRRSRFRGRSAVRRPRLVHA